MPVVTRTDQFGRPIYANPEDQIQNGRPDNPLTPTVQDNPLTAQIQANLMTPDRVAIGNNKEYQSNFDPSRFNDRLDLIQNQGTTATNNAMQAQYAAMQRRLQAAQQNGQMYSGMTFAPGVSTTDLRANLVRTVASFNGTPYKWGGASPGGFDCSGLVQYAYGRLGIHMPRTSGEDARLGVRVPMNKLQPGDLVAHPGHIAVYAGNGMMWEAPHTGARVRLVPVRGDMYGIHLTLPGDRRG